MKRILHYICSEALRLKREDQGVIMAISLAVWMFLFVLICGVYTLGTTIQEREALQHASDAAAISAATIQADALSRMATINKAMSYTYMSMSRKQMDCILMEWLNLTKRRFSEDETAAKDWGQVLFICQPKPPVDFITFILRMIEAAVDFYHANCGYDLPWKHHKCKNCPLVEKPHFCGVNQKRGFISINGREVRYSDIPDFSSDSIEGLKASIVVDKTLIRALNGALAQVHRSACESMERSVPKILQQNLSTVFSAEEMKAIYYTAKLPNGEWNPYMGVTDGGCFSALFNNENDERLFLGMMGEVQCNNLSTQGSGETSYWLNRRSSNSGGEIVIEDTSVGDFFVTPPKQTGGWLAKLLNPIELSTVGADQWWVRGRPFYGNTPTYIRCEGDKGLQRIFWDSNANPASGEFRGGGIPLKGEGPTRANHLADVSYKGGANQSNFIADVVVDVVNTMGDFIDIKPSVVNIAGEGDPRSCSAAKSSMALVADYEWTSGKWLCLVRKSSSGSRWRGTRRYYYHCRGRHFGVPKYYCGHVGKRRHRMLTNGREGNANPLKPKDWYEIGKSVVEIGTKTIPDVILVPPLSADACHGYDGSTKFIGNILKGIRTELSGNLRTGGGIPREAYESCALGFMTQNPFIGGCARVYADDKEICDFTYQGANDPGETLGDPEKNIPTRVDIYAGACAQPWILNERFFGTDGTITVAVAKRRANPFAKVIDKVWDVEKTSPTSIGNPAGEPDKETYMWTMSSARAAFRQSEGAPLEIAYRYLNPEAGNDCLSDSVKPGETGCVCGETAQRRLAKQWNLCTTYWEPVLLPVALADQYRAIDGKWIEEPWVQQGPLYGISALWKFFYLDMKAVQSQTGEVNVDASELGWRSLGGGDPMVDPELNFLRIESPARKDNKYFEILRQDSAAGSQSPLLYKQKLQ